MSTLSEEQAIEEIASRVNCRSTRYTMKEFQKLKAFLEGNKQHFIFEMDGGMAGLNLCVYRHPTYPLTPPQEVTTIHGDRLPEVLGKRLEDQFRQLSPFSHEEKNVYFLRRYRLKKSQHFGYYHY